MSENGKQSPRLVQPDEEEEEPEQGTDVAMNGEARLVQDLHDAQLDTQDSPGDSPPPPDAVPIARRTPSPSVPETAAPPPTPADRQPPPQLVSDASTAALPAIPSRPNTPVPPPAPATPEAAAAASKTPADSPDTAKTDETPPNPEEYAHALLESPSFAVSVASMYGTLTPRRASVEWMNRTRAAAHNLSTFVFQWRRMLGFSPCRYPLELNEYSSVCGGGSGGYCDRCDLCCSCQPPPTRAGRCCAPVFALLYLVITLMSLGAQWLRCKHEYLDKLALLKLFDIEQSWSSDTSADTNFSVNGSSNSEYVCQHSYLWMFLLPRIFSLFGYFCLFICWYCLSQMDIMTLVHKIHDILIQEETYVDIMRDFESYCDQDRSLMLLTFIASFSLSVLSVVVGDGTLANSFPKYGEWGYAQGIFCEVLHSIVVVVFNLTLTYGLMSQLLSLKYYELGLQQVVIHIKATTGNVTRIITARRFTIETYERLAEIIRQPKVTHSVVNMLALAQLSGSIVNSISDSVRDPPLHESITQLPQSLLQFLCVLLYMIHGVRLVSTSYRCHVHCVPSVVQRAVPPGSVLLAHVEPPETPLMAITPGVDQHRQALDASPTHRQQEERQSPPPEQPPQRHGSASRTDQEWDTALAVAPLVLPTMFGAQMAPWMFILLVFMMTVFTTALYIVESLSQVL